MSVAARLVLASGSETRRRLLAEAGLVFDVHPSAVDESVVKRRLRADGASASAVATKLAEAKAIAVSALRPGDLVIGADQILTSDDQWYDKPDDLDIARHHLSTLRGRSQVLHTACVLALGGKIVWRTSCGRA